MYAQQSITPGGVDVNAFGNARPSKYATLQTKIKVITVLQVVSLAAHTHMHTCMR